MSFVEGNQKLKMYCKDTNQCYKCFLNDTEIELTDGLCSICDGLLISDINWVKSLTTPQIEELLDAITDKSEYWTHIYLKELTARKIKNCQGCKDNCPNQLAHMAPGGCLDSDS